MQPSTSPVNAASIPALALPQSPAIISVEKHSIMKQIYSSHVDLSRGFRILLTALARASGCSPFFRRSSNSLVCSCVRPQSSILPISCVTAPSLFMVGQMNICRARERHFIMQGHNTWHAALYVSNMVHSGTPVRVTSERALEVQHEFENLQSMKAHLAPACH